MDEFTKKDQQMISLVSDRWCDWFIAECPKKKKEHLNKYRHTIIVVDFDGKEIKLKKINIRPQNMKSIEVHGCKIMQYTDSTMSDFDEIITRSKQREYLNKNNNND